MIQPTHSSSRILRPVTRCGFILLTLLLALFLNMIPLGRLPAVPRYRRTGADLLVCARAAQDRHGRRISARPADGRRRCAADRSACAGLCAAGLRRQLAVASHPVVPPLQQALHVLPLLFMAQLVMLIVRLMAGAEFPGSSISSAAQSRRCCGSRCTYRAAAAAVPAGLVRTTTGRSDSSCAVCPT
jgi:rod shape-determining protein MreD